MLLGAAAARPKRPELRDDLVAERVPRPRERKCDVCVQAFQAARIGRGAGDPAGERGPQRSLLLVRLRKALREARVFLRGTRPPLDAARGFEPLHLGNELGTREPERRRERRAGVVERCLLRYCRLAERAADDDATKRARLSSDLRRDDLTVSCHRLEAYAAASTPRSP
jgi:hypothetical protein